MDMSHIKGRQTEVIMRPNLIIEENFTTLVERIPEVREEYEEEDEEEDE